LEYKQECEVLKMAYSIEIMSMPRKQERVKAVNQIIELIASLDRHFFERDGNIAKFEFIGERLYFTQPKPLRKIRPYRDDHGHFGWGGTLWGLVNDMREFIMKGQYSDGNNGYGGLYCKHWGYSEESMQKIILKARELGYL
jgi:hypothetical protein